MSCVSCLLLRAHLELQVLCKAVCSRNYLLLQWNKQYTRGLRTTVWIRGYNHVNAMFMRSTQSKHFALLGIICVSTAFFILIHLQGEITRLDEARIKLGKLLLFILIQKDNDLRNCSKLTTMASLVIIMVSLAVGHDHGCTVIIWNRPINTFFHPSKDN